MPLCSGLGLPELDLQVDLTSSPLEGEVFQSLGRSFAIQPGIEETVANDLRLIRKRTK